MREWFRFLESFCLDDQLYFALVRKEGLAVELVFRREEENPWRLRSFGALFWQETTSDKLLEVLQREEVDVNAFSTSLRQCILQQGAFAGLVQKEVERLFGDAAKTSEVGNEAFLKELADTVATMFPSQEEHEAPRAGARSKLKLVKT